VHEEPSLNDHRRGGRFCAAGFAESVELGNQRRVVASTLVAPASMLASICRWRPRNRVRPTRSAG